MTEPKYKPIIFSAPMVKAILEGRKTQTRRLNGLDDVNKIQDAWDAARVTVGALNYKVKKSAKGKYGATFISHPGAIVNNTINVCPQICPYGQPGDRLWVRENWRIGAWDENNGRFALDYCDGPDKRWITVPESTDDYLGEGVFEHYWMQCSDELSKKGILPDSDGQYHWEHGKSPLRWRPSTHMPRWASRINLEITGVRVERVQDISEDDVFAEGIEKLSDPCDVKTERAMKKCLGKNEWDDFGPYWTDPIFAYSCLWKSIYGPGAWEKNPWVWVVEFKMAEG